MPCVAPSVMTTHPFPTEVRADNRFLALAWGGRNLFLTGMAGTGKSTLLRHFIDGWTHPLMAPPVWPDGSFRPQPPLGIDERRAPDITAPTGIAALNVGGRTVHRFAGILLGPKDEQSDEEYFNHLCNQPFRSIRRGFQRVEECECLVIDEISMLPGRTFQFLEWLFCKLRGSNRPWGGAQVIVIGDFLQLAPVRTSESLPYDWCFNNPAWEKSGFTPIILQKVHRQNDLHFIRALTGVRTGRVSGLCAELLHGRIKQFPPAHIPRLYTHNSMVDRWNAAMLESIDAELATYHGQREGSDWGCDFLAKSLMCPEVLDLKTGAKVMTTINDSDGRFVNGSIGIVAECREDFIVVDFPGRGSTCIERFTWKAGDSPEDGQFTQFPLRLAYAMTIHKSQGITLDDAYIDIRAAREPGQSYVALSRVRTLEGLNLKDWFRGVTVSNAALRFYSTIESAADYDEPGTGRDDPGTADVLSTLREQDKEAAATVEGPAEGDVLLPGMEGTLCGPGSKPGGALRE